MKITPNVPSPFNHVFVDFENVQKINLAVIGREAVRFTLLVGPRQTKLDFFLAEKLLQHPDSVQLLRLASAGRNALDFTLAYYLGRAVVADPGGSFHIVSKDKGYDPLIEHLRSKQIRARRHDSFATLTFAPPVRRPAPSPPTADSKPKSRAKPRTQPAIRDERMDQVLEYLRKPSTPRPRNKKKFASFLVAYLGRKMTELEALALVENLRRAGHIAIGPKDVVTYRL